jgi:hypothetical protein
MFNGNLKSEILSELKTNKELITKGMDNNSSSGSDDCPSEDNLSKEALKDLIPRLTKPKKVPHARMKMKGTLKLAVNREKRLIVEVRKKRIKEEKKEKKKEEKKVPASLERKILKRIMFTPRVREKKEPIQELLIEPEVTYADASTQTEQIYFQKARAKWVMSKYGKSQTQLKRSMCKVYNECRFVISR